jgi:hypothetical protein
MIPVGALPLVMIQSSWLTALMAGVGVAQLLGASAGAAWGAAVALAAITMAADQELAPAIRGAAMEFAQDNTFSMVRLWHAPAGQGLYNREPLLSK